MGILSIVLLVFFIIISVLLILLVVIQTEDGNHLGGLFAGGSDSAFGSRSGNVLTRTTTILGALFLIVSLGLALLSRTNVGSGVEEEARKLSAERTQTNWLEEELNPSQNEIFIDHDHEHDHDDHDHDHDDHDHS